MAGGPPAGTVETVDIESGAGHSDDGPSPDDVTTDHAVEERPDAAEVGPGADGGTDDADDPEDEADDGSPDPLRFHRWMRTSSAGGVLTGIALGLQHALEEHREQPAFVMEAPGEPEDPDAPITLHFDPDDPTRTVAVVRSRPAGGPDPSGPGGTAGDGAPTTGRPDHD